MVDQRGIADNASLMLNSPVHTDPVALRAALDEDLAAATAPDADVVGSAVTRPCSPSSPHTEVWQMPGLQASELCFGARDNDGPGDVVCAKVFSRGPLGQRPVELFLPGAGVSDLAFRFLKHLFVGADDAGADVVVWVPPDHLDRQRGDVAGDDLFGADLSANLHTQRAMVREVRTIMAALHARGVSRIGMWAGSLGAAVGVVAASVESVDHIALMIPLLDWRTLMLEPESFQPVRERLRADGVDFDLLERALLAGSPVATSAVAPAGRGLLVFAEEDQLTPPLVNLSFAERHGFVATGYPVSHASILLVPGMYDQTTMFFRTMWMTSPP